jgi:hypothetical protein
MYIFRELCIYSSVGPLYVNWVYLATRKSYILFIPAILMSGTIRNCNFAERISQSPVTNRNVSYKPPQSISWLVTSLRGNHETGKNTECIIQGEQPFILKTGKDPIRNSNGLFA